MRIGLIAGGGQFPLIFSKKAKQKGFSVFSVAYISEADTLLQEHVDVIEWIHLGQVSRLIRFFKKHDVKDVVMIGSVKKTRMFKDIRPDIKAISVITRLKNSHDDNLLRVFSDLLAKEGIKIRSSTFLLPELIASEGCWTHRKPSRVEQRDIDIGWTVAKEIGRLDIGQCVVVGGGSVLAVEAIDGTDATIRRGGTLGNGEAVVVKVCKPNQDQRFDMPATGAQTIRIMAEVKARVLAIEAGKAVVFDREQMVDLADRSNIAIVALTQKDMQ
jgi:DUF1009 family protein